MWLVIAVDFPSARVTERRFIVRAHSADVACRIISERHNFQDPDRYVVTAVPMKWERLADLLSPVTEV